MVNPRTQVSRRPLTHMNLARKPGSPHRSSPEVGGSAIPRSIPDEPPSLSDLDVQELANRVYRLMQDDLRTHRARRLSREV